MRGRISPRGGGGGVSETVKTVSPTVITPFRHCKTVDVKALKTIVYSVIGETNLSYTETFISG